MEKAVWKTLVYADIFDYPMKAWEIHKWLIGEKADLRQTEKILIGLSKKLRVKNRKGFYFLNGKGGLVNKRLERQKTSERYFYTAKWVSQIFRIIPWIKLVGISGGLSMENAGEEDDIDLFIITQKNRVWICRLLISLVLNLCGKRRKREDSKKEAQGKVCINILLDEDSLAQQSKDIYLAHEVLQMKVLWEKGGVYSRYLEENSWVFENLPNWLGTKSVQSQEFRVRVFKKKNSVFFDFLENLARWWQVKYMGKPEGLERIGEGALYFLPDDLRGVVLNEFKKRIKNIELRSKLNKRKIFDLDS